MFSCRAATTAARSRGFIAGSGVPSFADTVISRASLPNSFDFWASCLPLRCMMFLNWEWPAIGVSWGCLGGFLEVLAVSLGVSSEVFRFVQHPAGSRKRGVIGRALPKIKDLA